MLALYLFVLMFTNSINQIQKNIHSTFINRITILTLLLSILFTYNTLYFQAIGKGISIYSGLFQITIQSQIVEMVLILVGISILLAWPFLYAQKHNITLDSSFTAQAASIKRNKILDAVMQEEKIGDSTAQTINLSIKTSDQYSLIAIFSILGGSLLMSSLDLLSMYLSIELQSFALYILATLNKERLSSTSAGLKYFLLGSLSSCFILLGSAIIYSYTGLTQFESINTLMSIPTTAIYESITSNISLLRLHGLNTETVFNDYSYYAEDIKKAFTIGLIILIIGFLFKISAAPFYQWAPDVYDGTPTIVTVWLTIVVKLTILIFLLGLIEYTVPDIFSIDQLYYLGQQVKYETLNTSNTCFFASQASHASHASHPPISFCEAEARGDEPLAVVNNNTSIINIEQEQIKNLLLISSLLSLLIGTIAGLSQIKFKRLLAFSSISHVGFLLLALGIYTQKSIDSFLFYLIQYSVTSLNIFLILLAFSYFIILPYFKLNPNLAINKLYQKQEPANLNYYIMSEATVKRQMFLLDDITNTLIPNDTVQNIEGLASLTSTCPPLRTHRDKDWQVNENNSENKKGVNEGFKVLNISASPTKKHENVGSPTDINYIVELKGQLYKNPILSISMAICLFSMAGLPPLIGFFSKQFVLFSSIENGYNFLSIIAILVSVISASYYLRLIKITFFDSLISTESKTEKKFDILSNYKKLNKQKWNYSFFANISMIHSYIIAILTFLILFFFLDPSILLNGTQLISLTIFNI